MWTPSATGMLDVYVLGAGASRGCGAPLANELLPYALNERTLRGVLHDRWLQPVRQFLRDVFGFDPDAPGAHGDRPRPEEYPGLVDVLSMVDLAIDRKESL